MDDLRLGVRRVWPDDPRSPVVAITYAVHNKGTLVDHGEAVLEADAIEKFVEAVSFWLERRGHR